MPVFSIPERELLTGFLVFVRVLSLLGTNPVFGHSNIPMRIRLVFAIFVTVVLLPVVPLAGPVDGGVWMLAIRIAHESFIGLSVSFLIALMFSVVAISGQLIATSAGLQMAAMFDPTLHSQLTPISVLKSIVLFLIVLALDFHHVMIRGLVWSFTAIPPGGGTGGARVGFFLVKQLGTLLETSVLMALPVMLVVLIVNLAMAIIARVAPQMNVFFSVGGQLNEVLGLGLLGLSLPAIGSVMISLFSGMESLMADVIRQFR